MEDSEKDPKLKEHPLSYDDDNAEIDASDNSFDSGREPGDEYELDDDPSRDHWIDCCFI